jgi:two-component system osmolarity sensor histidine kinase EnvZ
VLTRFKLELALLPDNPESQALRNDVNEMQHMLEDYLAFAKGDGGEEAEPTNVGELLDEVQEETEHLAPRSRSGCATHARAGAAAEAPGLQAGRDQSRHQCRPLRRLRRHPCRRGRDLAAHRGRRRRPRHPAGRARQRLSALLPARSRAQPGRGQSAALGWPLLATSHAATAATIALGVSSMGGLRATMRVPL